ncbi:hypothetical protein QCF01_18425, partial [Staphylococcus aureus]|nr:hypothetical protein [Staphylococcus aureus]
KTLDDPLRDDPVAAIDNSCVGCGNCGEVSEAAALCPSFYRAEVVHNPTATERLGERMTMAMIRFLQRRRAARRIAVSVVLILLVIVSIYMGWIKPHGIGG